MKVEENRPALQTSEFVAINGALTMKGSFWRCDTFGTDLGIICGEIKSDFITKAQNGPMWHLHTYQIDACRLSGDAIAGESEGQEILAAAYQQLVSGIFFFMLAAGKESLCNKEHMLQTGCTFSVHQYQSILRGNSWIHFYTWILQRGKKSLNFSPLWCGRVFPFEGWLLEKNSGLWKPPFVWIGYQNLTSEPGDIMMVLTKCSEVLRQIALLPTTGERH